MSSSEDIYTSKILSDPMAGVTENTFHAFEKEIMTAGKKVSHTPEWVKELPFLNDTNGWLYRLETLVCEMEETFKGVEFVVHRHENSSKLYDENSGYLQKIWNDFDSRIAFYEYYQSLKRQKDIFENTHSLVGAPSFMFHIIKYRNPKRIKRDIDSMVSDMHRNTGLDLSSKYTTHICLRHREVIDVCI